MSQNISISQREKTWRSGASTRWGPNLQDTVAKRGIGADSSFAVGWGWQHPFGVPFWGWMLCGAGFRILITVQVFCEIEKDFDSGEQRSAQSSFEEFPAASVWKQSTWNRSQAMRPSKANQMSAKTTTVLSSPGEQKHIAFIKSFKRIIAREAEPGWFQTTASGDQNASKLPLFKISKPGILQADDAPLVFRRGVNGRGRLSWGVWKNKENCGCWTVLDLFLSLWFGIFREEKECYGVMPGDDRVGCLCVGRSTTHFADSTREKNTRRQENRRSRKQN